MVFSVSMSEITVSTQRLSWHSFLPFTQSEVLMLMHQSFGSGRFQARYQLLVRFFLIFYLFNPYQVGRATWQKPLYLSFY